MLFVLGWILILPLLIGWTIISYLLTKKKIIIRNTDKEFSVVKYALISTAGVVICFIVWCLSTSFNPIYIAMSLIFIPPYATLIGISGFLVSWAVLTLFVFFSPKHHSSIPKRKLIFHALLSVLILVISYVIITHQLLLYRAGSPKSSQTCLSEIYKKAIKKSDIKILQKLAKNPNTPIGILENIYESYHGNNSNSLFDLLAENKNTPQEVLEELAKNRQYYIRESVAKNPNTPIEVLRILADDVYYSARIAVAKNPNVTRDILLKLKSDRDEGVKKAANSAWSTKGFDKTSE